VEDCELSVIVPVFNEEHHIGIFVERIRPALDHSRQTWEIVVVDDGSHDDTQAVVEALARNDARIRLIRGDHRGKGSAIRLGLREARGEWVFMADADLAMPPDNLTRFLSVAAQTPQPDLVIGSREAPGAMRMGEPWRRYAIGRAFNWFVRLFVLPGVADTQCGFKLFRAAAIRGHLDRLTIDGFAFDVEMLLLARRAGLDIREVGIVWHGRDESGVSAVKGAAAFADVLRIRCRHANRYTAASYVLALVLAISFGADLFRMPIQVSDSIEEIIGAQAQSSIVETFVVNLGQAAYLRPLRRAQIKAVYDLSGGRYHAAYRGFHVALFALTLLLFVRALRVSGAADLAAAAFAMTVFLGLHTFYPAVGSAYPINHFLEIILFALLAFNLAQGRPSWGKDVAAVGVFVAAALTLETGLLVWVVLAAAWFVGMRGVSRRGVAAVTVLLAAYLFARFVYLGTGTPLLSERSSGFLFEVLDPEVLEARFGASPWGFYAYNVASSAMSVLTAEPRAGVLVTTRAWLESAVPPWALVALVTSVLTTVLIAVAAWRVARERRTLDHNGQMLAVFAAVLVANCVMSYAYTKDEIVSVAGAFYALAAYAAVRVLSGAVTARGRGASAVVLALVMAVVAGGWSIRAAGLHHVLVTQAFKQRLDWAGTPALPIDTPASRELMRQVRAAALARPVVAPRFVPPWAARWFEEY
jgi:dolichyl-phosphate beta-glucosyltransferase